MTSFAATTGGADAAAAAAHARSGRSIGVVVPRLTRFAEPLPLACGRVLPEFELAYEFTTHILEKVVGPVFGHIANTFVDAFVRRAEAIRAAHP